MQGERGNIVVVTGASSLGLRGAAPAIVGLSDSI